MKRRLDIVGGGAVGRTLGRLWYESGDIEIGHVVNRSLASAREAVRFIGCGQASDNLGDLGELDIVMLAVSDDAIESCASALSRVMPPQNDCVVFHCSGALSAAALSQVQGKGARTASLHPVKTFASPEAAIASFVGTYCGLEGEPKAITTLRALVEAIGGVPFEIDGSRKALYHAGSVFACNYLTALLEVGLRCHERAGLSRETASALLAPLATETVRNAFSLGPAAALTGPIARGDTGVVRRHVAALADLPSDVSALYALLGRVALELSRSQGTAEAAALRELERVLRESLEAAEKRP